MRTSQLREPAQAVALTASQCEVTLKRAGLRLLGKVHDSAGVIDFALVDGTGRSIVVRCINEPRESDHVALGTMLTEGDFTRAFIVYTAEDQPNLSGEIEAYPLSRIDELAALLAKGSAP
jgi:hypothetical protein